MTDRAFEPPEDNPFAQFGPKPLPDAGLPKPEEDGDAANPFAQFGPKPQPEPVGAFGAFRRGAVRGVVPAATGLAAAAPAAEAGAVAGGFVAGPPGAFVGGIIGGVGGAIAGGMAGEAAQHWALSKLPESWVDALGMSDRQQKLDEEQAPKASFLGGLAPYAITMRPGGFARKTLPENSTALERIMAHPATARVFGGGIMGGMELGQEAAQGESPNWTKVAISTGFGLVFNKPTRIGEAIGELGARPVRRFLGRPEMSVPPGASAPEMPAPGIPAPAEIPAGISEPRSTGIAPTLFHAEARPAPTVADAADLNVAGPGVTETVFLGSHERDPVATEASRETKRTEQSVIGPGPAPPDVHSVARQMHFDLFSEYDALRDRRRALEAEPGAADHLAATEARLAELEKDVQAANRRAAEAAGQPIHEAPVEAPPIAPDIETQKAAIAADVSQQLRAAGRPLDEAEAAGKLIAARYAARAGAFKGALGTAEELYRREGAEIRAMEIRRKVSGAANPATMARALDDFQQRMAAGKEAAAARRNQGGSAVKIISTKEKFAGTNEADYVWDQFAADRQARREASGIETSHNAETTKSGAQVREKRSQEWEPGNTVDVGFVKNLLIADRNTDGTFTLLARPDEGGISQSYNAKPHGGLVKEQRVDFLKASERLRKENIAKAWTEAQADAGVEKADTLLLTPHDLAFMASGEFFQRRTAPPGPDLFTQREAEGQMRMPGPLHVVTKATEEGRPIVLGAHRTPESATTHQESLFKSAWDKEQRENFEPEDREEYPGREAFLESQKNAAREFSYPHEIPQIHETEAALDNEAHVVATGIPDEVGIKIHGAFATAEEATAAADKVARDQWENGHGKPVESDKDLWDKGLRKAVNDWNKAHGTDIDPEVVSYHSDIGWYVESLNDDLQTHRDPVDPELNRQLQAVGDAMAPYPGLKKAAAYWREQGDADYLIPTIAKMKVEGDRLAQRKPAPLHEEISSAIKKALEKGDGYYGLRVTEHPLTAGEALPPGRTWYSDFISEEHDTFGRDAFPDHDTPLAGTPSIGLKSIKDVDHALRTAGVLPMDYGKARSSPYGHTTYYGRYVSLIKSDSRTHGADPGEWILPDATVVKSWDTEGKEAPAVGGSLGGSLIDKSEPKLEGESVSIHTPEGDQRDIMAQRETEGQVGLPGTERISEAELAQRRANEPLKPGVAQKPIDIGLFSDEAKQRELFQKALGSFMPPQAGARSLIKLAKDANASTFMHESGHDFLEQMMRDDAHPLAPADLKADAKTVRDWLGIENHQDLNTGWPGERGRAARQAHEKFARGFEQYLREGHAPSTELKSVFERFRQWLWHIYDTVKKAYEQLGEPISDDIKRVFGRLLTAEPQRTVIAPERDLPRSLADIHEADAAFYAGHEMEGVGDRIAAERDRAYAESPHAPSAETKLVASEAAEPGGEIRAGEPQGGEVYPDGVATEPDAGRGGPGGVDETQLTGGAEGLSESPGARGGESEPGRERSESVPLAGRPAENLTVGGQSFNVGKDGNVRAENITSVPQFIEAINESSDRIATGNDNILTMGQMKGIADDFGLDAKTIDETRLAGMFGGLHNIAAKIRAFRETVLTQSKTVHGLMQAVKETNSDQAVAEFAKEAARLDMMMSVLSSVTTEMGRGLGMGFKNLEGWKQAKDLNEFLKANTGKELFQLKMIAKLGSQLDSPAKVARFLRDAQNRSFGGMVLEYWINGLISGIATHSTYAVGNSILTAEKLGPETAAAAMIGAARKAMGREGETVRFGEVGAHFAGAVRGLPASLQAAAEGLRTGLTTLLPGESARPLIPFTGDTGLVTARTIGNEPVSWGELGADLFGMVRGLRDGIVSGAALIKAGGEAGAPAVGFSYSPLGQIPDIAIRGVPAIPLGSAIRVPGRFIAAIHSFFRTTNYSAYRAGGAYRTAIEAGERAKAEGRAFSGSDFDAETANAWLNPSEAQMEKYRLEATETALMGHAGKFTENLQRLTNTEVNLPVIGGVRLLKFVDPFVHISSNIIKQTVLQRTPLGLLSSELRADLSGANGNIAQDTAMARMLVGSALSLTFGGLAAQGYITGSGPKDPHEAAMWREVYQPHSVRVGDMWYQVNRLGPMGMLLGIAADLYEVAHDATEGDLLKAAAHLQHAFTQNILDESFMRGPADLIKAVEDPGRYGEGYIKNFASSFVPFSVGMAQMARAADPYSRQARNVMDAIRAKVPGYSQELLPRRNIWGDEIPNLPALGGRAISALYEKQVNSDPVNQAMVDLGVHPAMPERKIRNIELTDQQYDDFTRIAGRMAKQRLDIIVRSPDWQTWPNHSRHDVIAEVVRQSREAARGMVMMKYPKIPRDAAEALRKKKTGEK